VRWSKNSSDEGEKGAGRWYNVRRGCNRMSGGGEE
jgi:hypothetical protein